MSDTVALSEQEYAEEKDSILAQLKKNDSKTMITNMNQQSHHELFNHFIYIQCYYSIYPESLMYDKQCS